MKITLFGTGYVGLVTGVCFAELGHEVLCVDIDATKIAKLQQGQVPIYEPGVEDLLQRQLQAGRIAFTTDAQAGVAHGMYQFIAVGTPANADGSADCRGVQEVARQIAEGMDGYRIIVTKSTVPVGTAKQIHQTITAALASKQQRCDFDVVSNPEFLREGAAVEDCLNPDRIVVGADNPTAIAKMRALYEPMAQLSERLVVMDIASAELTKYAANAFLATKISFINEISRIAEQVGADIEQVRHGMGKDKRINTMGMQPGCGYGGSCFPKDVRALEATAKQHGAELSLLPAVQGSNHAQKRLIVSKIRRYFDDDLNGKVFALWGLAFKANTSDMRDASSQVVLEALWQRGATVQAYDPAAMPEAGHLYGKRDDLRLAQSASEALSGADALIVLTEWDEFRQAELAHIKSTLRYPVVFDGRNLYSPQQMATHGLEYYAIGRPTVLGVKETA